MAVAVNVIGSSCQRGGCPIFGFVNSFTFHFHPCVIMSICTEVLENFLLFDMNSALLRMLETLSVPEVFTFKKLF
jgi:hypothetical protein